MENPITEKMLQDLGFETASAVLTKKRTLRRKLMLAYEHFRFVSPEVLKRFNDELETKTMRPRFQDGSGKEFDRLAFIPIKSYKSVPPSDVLVKVKEAKDMGIFDEFLVGHIERVKVDPIIFGRIQGCADLFYIAQWDDDVKIENILRADEG